MDDDLPAGLTEEFYSDTTKQTQWKAFVRKSNVKDASPDLETVLTTLVSFVKPLLTARAKDESFEMSWETEKWSKRS